MPTIEDGLYQLGQFDRLASMDTPTHRLDPRAKLMTTIVFLVCVVSFGKYEVLPLLPFALYPITLAAVADVPLGMLARRVLVVAPLAVCIGMFNPIIDRGIVAHLGAFAISGGWVSFTSIVVRFALTTVAALVLIATTGIAGVCMAMERLGVPDVLATQVLFLYRYIFVLGEEGMRMARARALRSFGGRGMGVAVYGHLLGSLLLRTFDRARRVYAAMLCRGFDGRVRSARPARFTARDAAFTLVWCSAFLLFRTVNVPLVVGRIVTGVPW